MVCAYPLLESFGFFSDIHRLHPTTIAVDHFSPCGLLVKQKKICLYCDHLGKWLVLWANYRRITLTGSLPPAREWFLAGIEDSLSANAKFYTEIWSPVIALYASDSILKWKSIWIWPQLSGQPHRVRVITGKPLLYLFKPQKYWSHVFKKEAICFFY